MGQRSDLHAILKTLLDSDNVYFQPPSNVQMAYPCIVYNRDYAVVQHSDNLPYLRKIRYQVTVIDRNPDSEIPEKVAALPLCSFDRAFVADNLHHDVFQLFF